MKLNIGKSTMYTKITTDAGVDITADLRVRRISMDLTAHSETIVVLECYAEEVVIEPDTTRVEIVRVDNEAKGD